MFDARRAKYWSGNNPRTRTFFNSFVSILFFFFCRSFRLLGLYFPRTSASSAPPIARKNVSTSLRGLLSRRLFVSRRRVSPRRVNESACAPRRRPPVEMRFVRCFGNVFALFDSLRLRADIVSVGPTIAHPRAFVCVRLRVIKLSLKMFDLIQYILYLHCIF